MRPDIDLNQLCLGLLSISGQTWGRGFFCLFPLPVNTWQTFANFGRAPSTADFLCFQIHVNQLYMFTTLPFFLLQSPPSFPIEFRPLCVYRFSMAHFLTSNLDREMPNWLNCPFCHFAQLGIRGFGSAVSFKKALPGQSTKEKTILEKAY